MSNADQAGLEAEVETLKAAQEALLDELEQSYLQMRQNLLSAEHEREVTYGSLRERNRDLRNRLTELEEAHRKLEKAHQELKHAQQMLVRSERLAAMGEMAAAIVHEIKNPLTAILGNLELFQVYKKTPTPKDLEGLYRSALYLKKLTGNILGFSRRHQGAACDFDMNALLEELSAFLEPFYKGMEIEMALDREIPKAWADPHKVEQALMNLVLNAVDAMDKRGEMRLLSGTGTIAEAIKETEAAGRPCALAVEMDAEMLGRTFVYGGVQDSGPGIEEIHMAHVFEAFFTTKEEGKGTGLGLSIVRSIVEECGGNILLDSKAKEGACFRVFMPPVRTT